METDYHPSKYKTPYHEVLPKKLRSRNVPGFAPSLHNIQEESNLSRNDNLPSPPVNNDHVDEPFHVDEKTIGKMQNDLNKIKLVIKKDPNTKNWVSYENIRKFPEAQDEDE